MRTRFKAEDMANVKNASIREIVIDRCLQAKGGRTVQQIMKACNEALDLHGYRLVTSPNTIRADFESISNRWHQVIESKRSGRQIFYKYKDRTFSIFNNPLSEEDIMKKGLCYQVGIRYLTTILSAIGMYITT